MSLLGAEYVSSDDEPTEPKLEGAVTNPTPIVAAPEVVIDVWSHNVLA